MTKTELRKQLEEAYFEGLCNGWYDLEYEHGCVYYSDDGELSPKSDEPLEEAIYGETLDPDEVVNKVPFKNALKRWNELKNSPLYKALS